MFEFYGLLKFYVYLCTIFTKLSTDKSYLEVRKKLYTMNFIKLYSMNYEQHDSKEKHNEFSIENFYR